MVSTYSSKSFNCDDETKLLCGEYCRTLLERGIRAELDDRAESIGYKIREANGKYKVPVQLIIGKNEVENREVNIRRRGSQEQTSMKLDEFLDMIVDEAQVKFDK